MHIGADARFFPCGDRAFVAGSDDGTSYLIDAALLAERVLPTLDADVASPLAGDDGSTLQWYLRRATAVRFADLDDDNGATRKDFATAAATPAPADPVRHESAVDESDRSIFELLQRGTARSEWVARNWPDSDPDSFSMSFGRAFRYVVTRAATESAPTGTTVWAVTDGGPTRFSVPPKWTAALRDSASVNVQIDVCADLEAYVRRYRHEFALQTLQVEAGRIAGDLIAGAVAAGWEVHGTTLTGAPLWAGWLETHAVVEMVRIEVSEGDCCTHR